MTERPLSPELMSRREALLRLGALTGTTLIGAGALVSGCATQDARPVAELFSAADVDLLDLIADTILPETSTPGAKAAGVGAFMAIMVADTYTAREQAMFRDGFEEIDALSRVEYGVSFPAATQQQRTSLLERLDREQYEFMRTRADGMPDHYFRMIKDLTLQGYFTSEIGYTEAMRYVESPGRFEPCIPYEVGDRAWASHA